MVKRKNNVRHISVYQNILINKFFSFCQVVLGYDFGWGSKNILDCFFGRKKIDRTLVKKLNFSVIMFQTAKPDKSDQQNREYCNHNFVHFFHNLFLSLYGISTI